MKYIYHHLGLGDHIICNGLVRSLINPNEEYYMFVKEHNLESVKFMYKDLINLDFIIGDDNYVKNYIVRNNILSQDLITAGFTKYNNSKSFDESFYLQNNLPFEYRWSRFYVKRNKKSESELYNSLKLNRNEYIFIHDDVTRNYIIDENLIDNPNNLKLVRPKKGLTNNIFDYCKIIENSFSAHFIDSSFRLMSDSLSLKVDEIYYHLNMKNNIKRNINSFDDSVSKLNFKII